jgi:YfiH family protein
MISPSSGKVAPFLARGPDGLYYVGDEAGPIIGTAGKKANPVTYDTEPSAVRTREKEFLAGATGLTRSSILMLNQVHGDEILHVTEPPLEDRLIYGKGDGFITPCAAVCLVIRTADCVPVFIFDRRRRVLGAAHAGWRGARLGIAQKLVREMGRLHGCGCDDMRAYLLPSIGPVSYRVGRDVADLFQGDVCDRGGDLFLDLWGNIERSLAAEGIARDRIFNARACTLERNGEFYSYRAGETGRNLNFGYYTG